MQDQRVRFDCGGASPSSFLQFAVACSRTSGGGVGGRAPPAHRGGRASPAHGTAPCSIRLPKISPETAARRLGRKFCHLGLSSRCTRGMLSCWWQVDTSARAARRTRLQPRSWASLCIWFAAWLFGWALVLLGRVLSHCPSGSVSGQSGEPLNVSHVLAMSHTSLFFGSIVRHCFHLRCVADTSRLVLSNSHRSLVVLQRCLMPYLPLHLRVMRVPLLSCSISTTASAASGCRVRSSGPSCRAPWSVV